MSKQTIAHATFSIERDYRSEPSKAVAASPDPNNTRRWFVEGEGFDVKSFEMDFRVGGTEKSRFHFGEGLPLPAGTPGANDSWYCDIVPNERIVLAYVMTVGGARISSSLATFRFLAKNGGTRLVFTEQAVFFEGGDGPVIREQGWRALFDALERELASRAAA
jgi:uncharacterized protein YndB with AHSA1/START domain